MLDEPQPYCTQCGAPGKAEDRFCRQCGIARTAGQGSEAGESSVEMRRTAPPPPEPRLLSGAESDRWPAADASFTPPPFAAPPFSPAAFPGRGQPGSHTLAFNPPPAPALLAAPPPLMPALITCAACSRPLVGRSDRCVHCGASRAIAPAGICFHCGAGNPSSHRYCARCGALLVSNALAARQQASSSVLPVIGSVVLPGLGQMMNGEALKGFMLLAAALFMLGQGASIMSPPYLLITAIAAIDAAMSRSRRDRISQRPHDIS